MKKYCYLILIFLFEIGISKSQNIINVSPGDGTLKQAINSAQPGDILKLTPGASYTETQDSYIPISTKITIEADGDQNSRKPIITILKSGDATNTTTFFYLRNGAAVTFRGLEFDGRTGGKTSVTNFIKYDVGTVPAPINIKYIKLFNCNISYLLKDVLNGQDSPQKGNVVVDSVIFNNNIIHDIGSGGIIHFKYSCVKYIEVKNCTFYKFTQYGIRVLGFDNTGQYISPNIVIDRVTMDNVLTGAKNFIDCEQFSIGGCTITNSIFSNLTDLTQKGLYWKNKEYNYYDSIALVTNCCLWNDGKRDFRLNTFKDTVTMDPGYANASNGDFTLPSNSPLQKWSTSKGPIGDPRWGKISTGVDEKTDNRPVKYSLEQNFPNPFNPCTTIRFNLEKSGKTILTVYNVLGKQVLELINNYLDPGTHTVNLNAQGLSSGVYYYRLISGNLSIMRKMVLLK